MEKAEFHGGTPTAKQEQEMRERLARLSADPRILHLLQEQAIPAAELRQYPTQFDRWLLDQWRCEGCRGLGQCKQKQRGMPFMSAKDESDLRFGCQNDVDFISASFVRRAEDVNAIRKILIEEGKPKIQIIAKIENQEGFDNLESILEAADGVMFDDVFNAPVFNMPGDGGLMKTDIAEKDGKYNLTVDMPGFRKEDIKVSLFKGNLTVSASHNENKDQKDEKGNVIRQERYSGSCSRTFYVGDNVKEEDITAAYTNGVLELSFPSAVKKAEEEKKFIDIK